jgi:hypothetical protein
LSGLGEPARKPVPSRASLRWATAILFEESERPRVVCDVGALTDPDLGAVEELARAQLTARRLGLEVGLRYASRELCEVLDLVGLCDVLPTVAALSRESSGEIEQREEGLRVQEEADPGDPAG